VTKGNNNIGPLCCRCRENEIEHGPARNYLQPHDIFQPSLLPPVCLLPLAVNSRQFNHENYCRKAARVGRLLSANLCFTAQTPQFPSPSPCTEDVDNSYLRGTIFKSTIIFSRPFTIHLFIISYLFHVFLPVLFLPFICAFSFKLLGFHLLTQIFQLKFRTHFLFPKVAQWGAS
jgi:hypothetical protein